METATRLAEIVARLREHPVGAAIKEEAQLEPALESPAAVLFILRGDGLELGPVLRRIHAAGKLAAVHLDLVEGIGRDHVGVRWLVRAGADAVISSHGHLVRTIRASGVVAIQRLLLSDGTSIAAGLAAVERASPDLVEVLPGAILPHVRDLLATRVRVPLLAGGFIRRAADLEAALAAGAFAVSTSSPELWGRR
ncbi:MAG TPA: glycerol-3-phosphate responsive antiterminator [Candidatus Dormibacteraeota bacterium]|nr:glycerol-3-phosphate responsive antiterminator [Candidatus Dormibacteraeota bacterium]